MSANEKSTPPKDPMEYAAREAALQGLMDNWLSVDPFDRLGIDTDAKKTGEFPRFALVYANEDGEHSVELHHYPSDVDGKPMSTAGGLVPWQLVDLDTGRAHPIISTMKVTRADESYDIVPDADDLEIIAENING